MLNEQIAAKISEQSENYYQLNSDDRIIMFTAASCRASGERTIELAGPIRLFEYDKVYRELICQWDSNSGKILLDSEETDAKLVMDIDSPTWQLSDGIKRIAQRHVVKYISFPEDIEQAVENTDVLAIENATALPITNPTDLLKTKLEQIHREVGETINQITAEIHSRLVFGLGCITLVMISIALGILLKGGHLLSAFGASSIPAGVLIVCLMAGKNLTKAKTSVMADSTGIIIMWAGLAALTIFCLIIYRKLTRT
jgi:lipopolysaccharide export LptBFGC system permease protein LptF